MQGAPVETVARALANREPLPDTGGFAGSLADGRAVRDVLGRYPLFTGRDDPTRASPDPTELDAPVRLPPGVVRSSAGDERVWTLPDLPPFDDDRRAIDAVAEAVTDCIDAFADDAERGDLAVAFSGGVDSAAVAARLDAPLYVAGLPDQPDPAAARSAARLLGREADLSVVTLDEGTVRDAVRAVARATGRTNAMDVAIAVPLYAVAERARGDGYGRLAVGQGADELFGGYEKVARAPDDPRLDATTVRGAAREMVGTLPDQLERDVLALRAAGVEPAAPLLHDRVVRAALRLPGHLLADDRGERKIALRRAVREFIPDRIAFRGKRAVQYGTGVADELDRLARAAGFARSEHPDHVAAFVRSVAGTVPTVASP